ncbi:hypothetical protein I3842_06G132300 [Carya illinoinensis]|uniref:RRM domain-containing protein n=1 Tax=Carya illinoinensis TaxID=32201 RepID=A0A922EVE1_CARIL|nr:hypothetical protein I3842_06G132300 [Carya illinoinensis]
MGKRKKTEKGGESRAESEHCPSTLFVSNLPYSFTNSQLEETFSDVGPVRRCFMVMQKGSTEHRGFGFIQFAVAEDANRAIELKNGSSVGGRKIAVKPAKRRASLEQRRSKADQVVQSNEIAKLKNDKAGSASVAEKPASFTDEKPVEAGTETTISSAPADKGASSEKQKVARTVIFGGLLDADMAEEVHKQAKEIGSVCSVTYPLPKEDLDQHGLIQDGCKMDASAVLYTSVKSAHASVAMILKQTEGEDDLQRTIFINNLPFDLNNEEVKQRFSGFGEVQSFVPVLHQVTKRPRGTGFLKFKTTKAASAAVTAANVGSGLGICLKGRQLTVLKALDKKSAHDKELEKAKNEVHDPRYLYLAKEGLILDGTPAAEGVSASDMSKRQTLESKKMTKLESPNFHVSRTRLVIYNLPKSMTEKGLKKLCIDAVTSRATKQKPVIKQIKFLEDIKKGKVDTKHHSRGVAFVEFAEHQHALVALRVLNNNPDTFGPEHRPIVEFALDNVQTLNQRKAKIQANQHSAHNDRKYVQKSHETRTPASQPDIKKSKKRKSRGDDGSAKDSLSEIVEKSTPDQAAAEGHRASKKQKSNLAGAKEKDVYPKGKPEGSKWKSKNHPDGRNPDNGRSLGGKTIASDASKLKTSMEADVQPKKRELRNQRENPKEERDLRRGKRPKKRKDPVGQDAADKLDMLIEQYRSKFSRQSDEKTDGEKQGSRQLRKWFQS